MEYSSFFGHKRRKFFWLNLIALIGFVLGYVYYAPFGGRNGGTILGYAYGGVATLAIIWLTWFGIRKRSYYSASSTVRDWLAGHVWLGLMLIVLVPLHSGFSFGINLHTLAYVLMLGVIFSGLWGALNYVIIAPTIPSHRGQGSLKEVVEQLQAIESDLNSVYTQSPHVRQKLAVLDISWKPGIWRSLHSKLPSAIDHQLAGKLLSELQGAEREAGSQVVNLQGRRLQLRRQLEAEVRAKTLLRFWLYIHVPLTCALLVALAAHIFSVFYYW